MSGFSEDERIRHKNTKFADSIFSSDTKNPSVSLVMRDVSLVEIIALLKERGLKVSLNADNVMVVSGE